MRRSRLRDEYYKLLSCIGDKDMQLISGNGIVRDSGISNGNGVFCVHVNH